ncbi:MAG TPA: VOC family protein [Burkholderiaceae bacterium]
MIDHTGIVVSDYEKSRAFYETALAPLGFTKVLEFPAAVDAFCRAAMDAEGCDSGAPGIRAHYHPNYYGAFVLDPDGHNIEAVCHQ